jgi:TetR/AcrR family transcriptional regulator
MSYKIKRRRDMVKQNKVNEVKTKDKILKAAIDEFVEYGFYGARTQRIANRAKVNKAMLHYYFSSKEKIYEQVLSTVAGAVFERLTAISDEPVPIERKIEQIMDVYIEVFTKYNDYLKIFLYEIMRGGDRLRGVVMAKSGDIHKAFKKFMSYFEDQVKQGKIRKINGVHLFISIVSQMAPVYVGKQIISNVTSVFGVDKLLAAKMIAERKKFVIDLIMNGIRKG